MTAVNAYRMQHAREAAGLTIRQVSAPFNVDVRPGEYFGQMPPADLERVRDTYQVRLGWLEEEGPVGIPSSPWTIIEMISREADRADVA